MKKLLMTLSLSLLLAGTALAADGWERDSAFGKLYNPNQIVTVTGTIVSIDHDARPLPGMEPGVSSVLKAADGKSYNVWLGPQWFTEFYHSKWNLQEGDKVTVTGSQVTVDGKPALMLITGEKGNLKLTVRGKTGIPIWDLRPQEF